MTIIFTEGWDKYGHGSSLPAASAPLAAFPTTKLSIVTVNEWTSLTTGGGATCGMAAALSGTGYSMGFSGALTAPLWNKTFGTPLVKAVGNVCINYVSFGAGSQKIMQFLDGSTLQAGIGVDNLGHVLVYNKSNAVIGTSSSVWTANTVHYIAWEIQVGNASGTYKVWVDGTLVINGTGGAFNGTANTQYTQFKLGPDGGIGGQTIFFDHLIIDDGTGSAITSINPVIETDFPVSDSAVQFTNTATAFGAWDQGANSAVGAADAPGVVLFLRKFTPAVNMTLNSVSCVPNATSASAKWKAVLYTDSAGSPNALTATGTEVVGNTAGAVLTGPFSAGQALTGGTPVWIGFITDTSQALLESDTGTNGWAKTNTYASGAPNPAGTATSTVRANWILWGNCTSAAANWVDEAVQPPNGLWGDFCYVSDNTVGHEDLYNFGALSANPSSIVAVCVKGFMRDNDAGARTVTLNTKSNVTDSAGSNAGFNPTVTYGWFSSFFYTDPNTAAAWGVSGLNAAKSGFKITA